MYMKNVCKLFLVIFLVAGLESCGSMPVWYKDGVAATEIQIDRRQCREDSQVGYTVMTEQALSTRDRKHVSTEVRKALIDQYGYTKADRMLRRGTQPDFVFVWYQEEKSKFNSMLYNACMESKCYVKIKKDEADLQRLSYDGPVKECGKGYVFAKAWELQDSKKRKVVMNPIDDKSVYFKTIGSTNTISSSSSTGSTANIEVNNYNEKNIAVNNSNNSGSDKAVLEKVKEAKEVKVADTNDGKGKDKKEVQLKNNKNKDTNRTVNKNKFGNEKSIVKKLKDKKSKGKDGDEEEGSEEEGDGDGDGDDGDGDDESDDNKTNLGKGKAKTSSLLKR